MKKTYIIPAIQVVKIQTTGMIAISMYAEDAQDAGMSRRGSFWDDEEDYDE